MGKARPGEKRSDTQHRTPSQIKDRISGYEATPEQRKNRAQRNAARREMIEAGKAKKGDGKDVDHKRPIVKGGGNSFSNLRVESRKKNRGHGLTKGKDMPDRR